MSDINSIILVGKLTDNCKAETCRNNSFLHNFTIANNYYDHASKSNKASFFNITYFCKSNLSEHLIKGKQIAIQGCIRQNSYKDQNGNTKTALNIIADSIQLIGANNKDANAHITNDDEDVPF